MKGKKRFMTPDSLVVTLLAMFHVRQEEDVHHLEEVMPPYRCS
jgi:hypothetical protein